MPFEKSLFGRLATGGLDIDPELRATADRVTAQGPRQGVANAVGLLDPGIIPVIKEGPTPFNLGMLALGTGVPGSGKIVGLGARRAAKKRKELKEAVAKLQQTNASTRSFQKQMRETQEIMEAASNPASAFKMGKTPRQLREEADVAFKRNNAAGEEMDKLLEQKDEVMGQLWQMPEKDLETFVSMATEELDTAVSNLDLLARAADGDEMAVRSLRSMGFKSKEDLLRFMREQEAIRDTATEVSATGALILGKK